MQSIEERKAYDRVVRNTSLISDIAFGLCHIFYLVFFLILKTYVLVYINIGSIAIYLSFLLLIRHKKYLGYAFGVGMEVVIYMSVATILCGFAPGFHLCIIGLCILAFYTVYFSNAKRDNKNAVAWAAFSLIVYITIFLITSFNDQLYHLEKWANMTLFIMHASIVFICVCFFLRTFTNYAIKLEKRIMMESRVDNLTQIPNRHAFYNYLDSIEDKSDYVLAIFDIDDFKKVNDIYGHLCGDYILKRISEIATDTVRDSFVCRYGGEEFIIIAKCYGDLEQVKGKIDRIRQLIEEGNFVFNETNVKVTITIGISKYEEGLSIDKWIDNSDDKLYKGKNSGKNVTVM